MDAKKILFPFGEPREEKLLGLDRMARRLGVNQSWLAAEARAGLVPCLRAGNKLLFNPEAVEEVLAERAAGSGQAPGGERRM